MSAQKKKAREFDFTGRDFFALRSLIKDVTGIHLSENKYELVYGRLARRLRALKISSFADYIRVIQRDATELVGLCNAITTNLTFFFREPHHFEHLREDVLRSLARGVSCRRLRIWSAGCSTGEEPYSIAMIVAETLPNWRQLDLRILATDLDSEVLATAKAGVYRSERLRGVSPERLSRHFRKSGHADHWQIVPELASMITFRQLNLMHELPMPGPIDVIFLRNVIIYFDKETQRNLFERIACKQRPGHLLYLGHSETLNGVSDSWSLIGKTIYRRTDS